MLPEYFIFAVLCTYSSKQIDLISNQIKEKKSDSNNLQNAEYGSDNQPGK